MRNVSATFSNKSWAVGTVTKPMNDVCAVSSPVDGGGGLGFFVLGFLGGGRAFVEGGAGLVPDGAGGGGGGGGMGKK